MKTEVQLRREVIKACRHLREHDLVVATDGNISVRVPGDLFLITPATRALASLEPEDLCKISSDGRVLDPGAGAPSSEWPMHRAAYRSRPDIGAVVHAHPPHCIAFSLAGLTLAGCILPETVLDLGRIHTAEYFRPSSDQGVRIVARELRTGSAFILDRHGSLTVGDDLASAILRLERMERAAQITGLALRLGGGQIRHLETEQVEELLQMRRARGEIPADVPGCNACGACLGPAAPRWLPPPPTGRGG